MELNEAIMKRRSMRKYTDEPVSPEELEQCLEAARWAPSWANTQCTSYIVVTDAEMKKKISDCLPEKNPARRATADAPVLVVFTGGFETSGYKNGEACDDKAWHMFDVGLAMQNFCLKAWELGLGTVIVGLMDYRKIGELLGVPAGQQVVAFTPLGHATGGDRPPARKEMTELRHDEKW